MTEDLCILLRLVFPVLKHSPVFFCGVGKGRQYRSMLGFSFFLALQGFKVSSDPE